VRIIFETHTTDREDERLGATDATDEDEFIDDGLIIGWRYALATSILVMLIAITPWVQRFAIAPIYNWIDSLVLVQQVRAFVVIPNNSILE
jgi:hypothetical protein